tara:strand:- start:149 stop:379 length:231 start_codon:yes stop_codon:yes gene_type:complete
MMVFLIRGFGTALRCVMMERILKLVFVTLLIVSCGSDPYKQCMKEEKRKNAYLGEDDYIRESSKICARKARQSKSY